MSRSVLPLSTTTHNMCAPGQLAGRGLPRLRAAAQAAASCAALACGSAAAQATPPESAADQQSVIPGVKTEIVTVTATRRREPVRDVPLRVETLSAEALAQSGAANLSEYVGSLPGVHVSDDGGPGRGQVEIRGVGVGSLSAPTVGVYIDDVAFGSSTSFVGEAVAALDLSLLDLHHVELLRGPQGTLYGAGAMGGLLKYVTNDPDASAFSGKAGVGVRGSRGGALGHTENAVINVPRPVFPAVRSKPRPARAPHRDPAEYPAQRDRRPAVRRGHRPADLRRPGSHAVPGRALHGQDRAALG
jgi:iron complex outermembrane receptor protein